MFVELPQNLIFLIAGAFLLGWVLSYVSSRIGARYKVKKRDARDDRIRSLEAELRIAQTDRDKYLSEMNRSQERLNDTQVGLERRDNVITQQQQRLEDAARDLKDSVIKTRELRNELAERATENVHAEARIREVQTELSVARASNELLATGVLDYDSVEGEADAEDLDKQRAKDKIQGAIS